MNLQNLSKQTKAYLFIVFAMGIAAIGFCAYAYPLTPLNWYVVLPGLLVSAGAAMISVPIVAHRSGNKHLENTSMSLGMIPTFLLLIAFGPLAGVLSGAVSALVSTMYPNRSYPVQILFSTAAVVLAVLAASPVLMMVGLAQPGQPFPSPITLSGSAQIEQSLATLAAGAVYFLVNTLLVTLVISLVGAGGKRVAAYETWRDNYLWTFPVYIASAAAAALLYVFLPYVYRYWQSSIAMLALAVPVPVLIYYVAQYHRQSNLHYRNYIAELEHGREELQRLYMATVESFVLAIDAKDRYTQEHIRRVKDYSMELATEMRLSDTERKSVEYGALLHDIGKIAIPESILSKPGKLTPGEFETMKTHTIIGANILEPVRFPFPVQGVVRSHHERWDGNGYPDKLQGEQIPIGARILAVTDVFDALTTDRSYRRAWSRADTMMYLQKNMGSHFDPHVVSAFLRILRREEERAAAMVDGRPAPQKASEPFAV
ncbi:MAG: HD domain-containing protein [Armatimonadetes bacterium]|nr:HD domain-containing protein [Armatimonadota bacterium]